MRTLPSHSRENPELGFPIASTIGAVGGIATTVLGSVLGGESPAEKRRKALLKQEKRNKKIEVAKSNLEQLRMRLEREMTVEQAEEILESNAEDKRRAWSAEWRRELRDLPNGVQFAETIAEEAQQIYLETANWVITKSRGPAIAGGAAALIGAGGLAYTLYKRSQ
jgi:hypothetical protein